MVGRVRCNIEYLFVPHVLSFHMIDLLSVSTLGHPNVCLRKFFSPVALADIWSTVSQQCLFDVCWSCRKVISGWNLVD